MNHTTRESATARNLPLMEELARAHHRFSLFDAEIHRLGSSDLTAPQAKVIFCLGDTGGLTCSEITDRTLITKGTLTGVIDRLQQKGLVKRWGDSDDGRRVIVTLTGAGERVYRREFPRYVKAMSQRFDQLSRRDKAQLTSLLEKVTELF